MEKHGKLTILDIYQVDGKGVTLALCLCDCGNQTVGSYYKILKGHKKSCGCLRKENSSGYKHGLKGTHIYSKWCSIKKRCYDENCPQFANYGARGIVMDDDFKNDAKAFAEYMGDPPPDDVQNWSIDRIDNEKGYVRGNMRWATPKEQAQNKRKLDSNTSGVTGVTKHKTGWRAFWQQEGRQRSKVFKTFEEAVEYRRKMIALLNEQGEHYTESHGE